MDFARVGYDQSRRTHPIVQSLLDTDFYKLLMGQLIHARYRDVPVTIGLINRTTSVRLADLIDEAELREQLDHVRTLSFHENELIWIAGATFYGQAHIFAPPFIEFLRGLRLPPYDLAVRDGQFELTFSGSWAEVTWWEIHALSIVSELKTRAALARRSRIELDVLYAKAQAKLAAKLDRLKALEGLKLSDFGTRRRHSLAWQEWVVQAMAAMLGEAFVGTSNALFAFRHGLDAKGTNAHELPMVLAALADGDTALARAQYRVLADWEETYGGNLLVALPDTYGSTQFLKGAPDSLARRWKGFRPDSKPAIPAGEELIAWYRARGEDPLDHFALFSDGLDVEIAGYKVHGEDIGAIHRHFDGRIGLAYGWGTNASNDFRECDPRGEALFDPLSLVCKVVSAGGRPAVKLSDNHNKATGPRDEVERYRRVFGSEGVAGAPVYV